MNDMGKKIAELRKQANITQDELAEALDVTRQSVSQWESDTVIPKADKLKALCEYFNVRPDYFLFENSALEPLVREGEAASEPSEKQPRKKTAFIIYTITILVLMLAIIIFISWLASPAAAEEFAEPLIICLLILSSIILLVAFNIMIAIIVKYKRNT